MANNLLVDWLNNKKNNVQTNVLKKAATNTNNVTIPNLPIKPTTVSQTGLNLQKAQQPTQTKLNTLNSTATPTTRGIITNNPAFVNGQLINQNNSRFIGFQQPQPTTLNSTQPQAKNFGKLMNGGYTYIPSAVSQAENANFIEENKYRTVENALMDLQGDIYKNQRKLTKREILLNYPEFKDKIDTIMKVQDELLPINKAGQGVDMKQFEVNYPELIQPKNLQDIDKLKKQSKEQAKEFENLSKHITKALTTDAKGYSVNGLKYLKDADILIREVEKYKKNGVVGGATDKEILDYAIKQNPQLQEVYDEMNSLELSGKDKARLGKNDANVLRSMFEDIRGSIRDAAYGDHFRYTQDELQEMIDAKSSEKGGLWSQIKTFSPTWVDKIKEYVTRGTLDFSVDNLKDYIEKETGISIPKSVMDWGKEMMIDAQIQEDEARLEERKNKYLDPVKQGYYERQSITELLAEGDFAGVGYKMKQSVAENPSMIAEMGVMAINPAIGMAVMGSDVYMQENQEAYKELKDLGATHDEAEAGAMIVGGVNAAVELFMERVLGGAERAGATAFRRLFLKNAQKELIKEMHNSTTRGIVKNGVKEYINGSSVEGLEEVVQTIVSNAAKQTYDENQDLFEGVGQAFEGGFYNPMNVIGGVSNMAADVKENKDSIKQGFNNALVNGVEGYVNAKEGIKNFLDLNQKRKQVIQDINNKVESKKVNKSEDKNGGWSDPEKGIVSKVVGGVTKIGTNVYDNVVEPITDKVAEGITSTTAPQDKIFKALNPSINVLSRKKGNFDTLRQSSDRANELIIEYGRTPTNTAEYYQAIQDTKKDLWNNGIQQGLDKYRDEKIYVNDILDPVREEMESDLDNPLESLKNDANLLQRELQRLEKMEVITLGQMEDTIQKINAMLERGLPPDASQIYEKGMRSLVRQMRIQEDKMISAIPGQLRKFKKDYGALIGIEEEAQKRMIQDMKKKTGGNLYQNWGRIEGLGKMIKKGSFIEGMGQFLLGESLGKVKDTNFLIKSGFEGLREQYGDRGTPEGLKIKRKPKKPTETPTETPKNKVTSKKKSEKKAEKKSEKKEEKKAEQPKQEVKNKVTSENTAATEEYINETPQREDEKQVKNKVTSEKSNTTQTKKDGNRLSVQERLKANGFEDIDTKGINLDNIDVKKMSEILNKSRDYRLGKDENGEYRVGYGDGTPKEKVNGDEAQLLMNIRDKKTPEEMKGYTGDKALTGAKLGYNKPTKNVATEKATVTTKSEPKKEIKANGGMKKQTGDSRPAKFTNTILDIIESNGGLKDGYLKVEKSGFEPLYIEEIGGGKIAIGQTYIQEGDVMFDPEIVFGVDENGRLQAETIRNDSMGIYEQPIKPNDSFLDTWEVNLREFIKSEGESDFYKNYIKDRSENERANLLGRMASDFDYIINQNLGEGGFKHLRAENQPEKQLEYMKELKDSLPDSNVNIEKYENFLKELRREPKGDVLDTLNNLKSMDDLGNILKKRYTGINDSGTYEGELNGTKTLVWQVGDSSIFVKYGEGEGPAQARIDMSDSDYIDQIKELLSEINNDGEILESNRNNPYSTKTENTGESELPTISLDNIKNAKSYSDLMDLFDKSTHEGIIPRSDEKIQYKNTNYVGKVGDKDIWIWEHDNRTAIAIGEGLKKTEGTDNLGYERPTNIEFKTVFDIDDIKNEIEKAVNGTKTTTEITGEKTAVTAKTVAKSENQNIIGKNNSLTTKNNQNDTNLGRSQKTVGGGNGGNEGGVRNAVSNMQPNEQNQAGLQRASDTNGNGQLNTSREQADISGNGLTAGSESTRLTVGQQRKINEDSRNILEKHNFSISRSDYTPEELDTLFKYEGNGGLAKAGDENVKGTRYEFYTPKNAVSALQRGIQKYSDSPINSVEDPTAGKGNMLDGYGDNIDKYMYEISPVSGTIAKLRFPEAKVGIGEKDGDFQRRYLNYQGQKAYDTPRDGGHNVDAILLNPPFGKRITIKDEPQIKSLEDYFTKRSIEHDLKDGGMVGLLMPSRWLKAGDSYTKQRLADNTEFVDAYRLPAGVFSYTDVGSDLIILKKKKGANNNLTKVVFYDDNYFIANPDKVLGVEKQRTGRHGMETYIDGDPKVIDTLWQDTDIVPSTMNAVTDTANKTAVTAKSAPVENKPKNLVTNPPKEEVKFTPAETTDKPKAEKKTTTRKSKNAKQTISKGDKTDIGTYTVNGNEKAYDYQDATDADGFIDRSKLSISPAAVADGVDLLNYIDGKIQTDYLYFSGNIYAKLKQLEKDKPQMSDAQYKKQKEGLEAILPSKLSVGDITWSPTDKALMDQETDIISRRRDRDLREDVEEKMTIKNAFKKRLSDLPSSQFQGTDTSYWKIRDYIDGKRWSSERLTKRYNETDEEFEARKKAKKAEEEVKKQATKERAKTFFNDFIKEQLSPEIQNKITESYNTRLRAVVKPDYKNMPLSVKNMSATFHGKPLKIDPVQIEGINAMLSKGTMLIAHGVGYGKTLEGVVATVASLQKGWTKKPLFIVPKGTREDWIKTTHDLFPNQEIVDLGGLTVDDIKRLRKDLGNDVKNWIKDGQVAIITHNGFDNKINFKKESQNSLEGDLRDVMDSDNNTARQEDSLAENIQNIAETVNSKKDTKKLKGIKATLSGKYGDELLEELDQDLENMNEAEFVENFVNKTEGMFKEEELRKDAHEMYETKPIYIEDLGIDHITVDEVHNYKNIFTSAKSNYKKGEGPEEVNPYGKISGSSSARGRKMFATAQYILKNNDGRGVFSLSATPFNNQPIEVYNMLSLHAYNRLEEKGIQNINSFFDYFANFRSEWISNPLKKGGGEFGEVMKDFNNLPEMQRLVGEYIDYVGDNPNLVRPEKRMKKVILTPSDMQREIQQRLQQEEKRMNANGEGDSVLPIYNDMRLNIISPYLTSYGKLYDTPTWQEFIESSPKLKFAVDTIKALRDEGQNDGVFIYMPLGVEYHSLLKEAIENMVGKDRVKVGIINGNTTGSETVDGEKVEKRIAIADRFRKGELNVLIGGRNTSEGINLQDNGFITINTLIGWNPTEITQLNGRIHRQGNLRDHVIELLPLLTDGADIMMMQKYDEKANRINNIFESQGRTFNLEELDPEEEKMALNTDPVRKAELSIDMDKKRIQRDIQKLSSQNGTLKEIVTKMPKEETIKEQQERISKAQEELKQINEGMKALDQDSAAYRTLESQRDYTERNIKGEKERLKALEKDKTRAEARMQQYAIDTLEGVNQRISENDAKLDDLIEQEKTLQNELKERIEKYTKEQEEWRANMKTPEDYIEELKEDFRSKKIFADREELKSHLEEQKSKKNVLGNEKNKVTTQAARASRPSIRMNVEEREKKNATANPMNKVTSKKQQVTQNASIQFSPELVSKIDKLAEERGLEGNTIKKMKVLNKEVDKGKGYHTETENQIYNLKKQIIIEYVKGKGKTIKDGGQKNTIVNIRQGKTRVNWHVVGRLYRDLKSEGIIK